MNIFLREGLFIQSSAPEHIIIECTFKYIREGCFYEETVNRRAGKVTPATEDNRSITVSAVIEK